MVSGVLQHNVSHKALTRLSALILHPGSCWPCMGYDMHTQNHSTFTAIYSTERKMFEGKESMTDVIFQVCSSLMKVSVMVIQPSDPDSSMKVIWRSFQVNRKVIGSCSFIWCCKDFTTLNMKRWEVSRGTKKFLYLEKRKIIRKEERVRGDGKEAAVTHVIPKSWRPGCLSQSKML